MNKFIHFLKDDYIECLLFFMLACLGQALMIINLIIGSLVWCIGLGFLFYFVFK